MCVCLGPRNPPIAEPFPHVSDRNPPMVGALTVRGRFKPRRLTVHQWAQRTRTNSPGRHLVAWISAISRSEKTFRCVLLSMIMVANAHSDEMGSQSGEGQPTSSARRRPSVHNHVVAQSEIFHATRVSRPRRLVKATRPLSRG